MKKVSNWSNPLFSLERFDLIRKYENAKTDEEITNFYHQVLNESENNPVLEKFIYAMIDFSTGKTSNSINILL